MRGLTLVSPYFSPASASKSGSGEPAVVLTLTRQQRDEDTFGVCEHDSCPHVEGHRTLDLLGLRTLITLSCRRLGRENAPLHRPGPAVGDLLVSGNVDQDILRYLCEISPPASPLNSVLYGISFKLDSRCHWTLKPVSDESFSHKLSGTIALVLSFLPRKPTPTISYPGAPLVKSLADAMAILPGPPQLLGSQGTGYGPERPANIKYYLRQCPWSRERTSETDPQLCTRHRPGRSCGDRRHWLKTMLEAHVPGQRYVAYTQWTRRGPPWRAGGGVAVCFKEGGASSKHLDVVPPLMEVMFFRILLADRSATCVRHDRPPRQGTRLAPSTSLGPGTDLMLEHTCRHVLVVVGPNHHLETACL
ncbi:hypothetical protein GWK47_053364 [Chionoecetes opilio]|uniref:Uncharacterized protein n=1 Tax=Chionoecetes opilio TaxID=41210 RepID=A0A8J4Y5K7_CHIOP|nr:hypothetical protein GWK47_053364 [Chionoecetes opilio]